MKTMELKVFFFAVQYNNGIAINWHRMRSFFVLLFSPEQKFLSRIWWFSPANVNGTFRKDRREGGKSFPFRGAIIGTEFPQWKTQHDTVLVVVVVSSHSGRGVAFADTWKPLSAVSLSHKLCYLIICLPFYLTTDWLAGWLGEGRSKARRTI